MIEKLCTRKEKKETRISSDDVSEAQTVFLMTKISDISVFVFLNNFPRNT